jgi:hypothetical protein
MKTNNLTKRSLLTSVILMATAMFGMNKHSGRIKDTSGSHTGGRFWNPQAIYIPRRTKFKGYMRENRKYRTNKTK